jgi:hypothetical protein
MSDSEKIDDILRRVKRIEQHLDIPEKERAAAQKRLEEQNAPGRARLTSQGQSEQSSFEG